MKVKSSMLNYQPPSFNSKFDFIKPAFKASISDEFVTIGAENAGNSGNTVGWIAGALAILGSGFAFFRNRKANIDKKIAEAAKEAAEKSKKEAEEKAKKLEQEFEEFKKKLDETIDNAANKPIKSHESAGNKPESTSMINAVNHNSGSHTGNRTKTNGNSGNHNSNGSNNVTNVNTRTSSFASHSTATSRSTTIDSQQQNNHIQSPQFTKQNGKKDVTDMTIEEIMQEQQEWQENFNRKVDETMKSLEENKEAIEFSWSTAKRNELNNAKGFKRILGYSPQKNFLINKLINPMKNKQEVPSMVLMYGPKGTGKTLFSRAVAHEANAEYIKLDLMLDEQENLEVLKNAAENAKQTFEKTGKSTILHLDEIDGVVCDEKYADLLKNLSKEYHATLLATTNHPNEINPVILNANVEKMYIPPATKNDIAEILMYVLKEFAEPSIDYNKYAKMIIDNGNGSAYSNAKIYELADNIVNKHYGEIFNKKVQQKISSKLVPISEQEIRNAIENNLQPDITKETLETYKKVF